MELYSQSLFHKNEILVGEEVFIFLVFLLYGEKKSACNTVNICSHEYFSLGPKFVSHGGRGVPERIAKFNVDAPVTLSTVCTVHFNPEVPIVAAACCKRTNGKNLRKRR